jgi:O-antigen/teichoic acid export membrane protein
VAAVVVALLLQLIAAPAAEYFRHPPIEGVVRVLSIAYIFASLASVHYFLLLRDLNFRARAIPPVGQVVVAGTVAVLFAVWGFGVGSLVAREVASAAAGALLLWLIHPFRPHLRVNQTVARRILGYGVWVGAGLALLYLSQNADLFVGGRIIRRARDIGFYSTSWTLAFMVAGILAVLAGNVIFPTLSRVRDDTGLLHAKLLAGLQQVSIVMAPAGVLLACVAPVLIVPVLGHRFAPYRASFVVLSLLAVYAAIRTLLAVFFEGYKAVGKPWLVPAYNGGKLAVLVPSMIVGAHYGVVGLALGYVPVTLLEVPAALILVFVVLDVTPLQVWTSIRTPVLATLCMAAVAIVLESVAVTATAGMDAAALVLSIAGGAATYVAALYFLDRKLLVEARVVLFSGL